MTAHHLYASLTIKDIFKNNTILMAKYNIVFFDLNREDSDIPIKKYKRNVIILK